MLRSYRGPKIEFSVSHRRPAVSRCACNSVSAFARWHARTVAKEKRTHACKKNVSRPRARRHTENHSQKRWDIIIIIIAKTHRRINEDQKQATHENWPENLTENWSENWPENWPENWSRKLVIKLARKLVRKRRSPSPKTGPKTCQKAGQKTYRHFQM